MLCFDTPETIGKYHRLETYLLCLLHSRRKFSCLSIPRHDSKDSGGHLFELLRFYRLEFGVCRSQKLSNRGGNRFPSTPFLEVFNCKLKSGVIRKRVQPKILVHKFIISAGFTGNDVYRLCWVDISGYPSPFHHVKVVPNCV